MIDVTPTLVDRKDPWTIEIYWNAGKIRWALYCSDETIEEVKNKYIPMYALQKGDIDYRDIYIVIFDKRPNPLKEDKPSGNYFGHNGFAAFGQLCNLVNFIVESYIDE